MLPPAFLRLFIFSKPLEYRLAHPTRSSALYIFHRTDKARFHPPYLPVSLWNEERWRGLNG